MNILWKTLLYINNTIHVIIMFCIWLFSILPGLLFSEFFANYLKTSNEVCCAILIISSMLIIISIWSGTCKICNGCPFTHMQYYLEKKLGRRNNIDYGWYNSMAYKTVKIFRGART